MQVRLWLYSLLLVCLSVHSQEYSEFEGRVTSDDHEVSSIHVVNKTSKRATITDTNGFFKIRVQLRDTLLFTAVQFKSKELVVTASILNKLPVEVHLETNITLLHEVVVTPYNLSGNINNDLKLMKIDKIVTASTLNLPNADVVVPTQTERQLYTAREWEYTGSKIELDPIINFLSGRTKRLKQRIARNKNSEHTSRIRQLYTDSLYVSGLKIPKEKIDDFLFFCEVDTVFQKTVISQNELAIWAYMRKKRLVYLESQRANTN